MKAPKAPAESAADSASAQMPSTQAPPATGATGRAHGAVRRSSQGKEDSGSNGNGSLFKGHASTQALAQQQNARSGSQGPGVARRKLGHNRTSIGGSRPAVSDVPGWQNSDDENA